MSPIELGLGLSIAPLRIELLRVSVRDGSKRFGFAVSVLTFLFSVLDRDNSKPIDIEISREIDLYEVQGNAEEHFYRIVREILVHVMCHEVDEVLRINGKRVKEPHK